MELWFQIAWAKKWNLLQGCWVSQETTGKGGLNGWILTPCCFQLLFESLPHSPLLQICSLCLCSHAFIGEIEGAFVSKPWERSQLLIHIPPCLNFWLQATKIPLHQRYVCKQKRDPVDLKKESWVPRWSDFNTETETRARSGLGSMNPLVFSLYQNSEALSQSCLLYPSVVATSPRGTLREDTPPPPARAPSPSTCFSALLLIRIV